MNFEEYKSHGYATYSDFAGVVASIIEAAIKADPHPYRVQAIQRRAKSPDKLTRKMASQEGLDPERIEEAIKDLAGCRLVFYSNDDVARFLGSGTLRANFEIDRERTKHHHPVPGQTDPSNQYRGDNIVVALNADRAELPEYARFKGLICEVQVQTILNHAWSEMAHDITYKTPELSGFGTELLKDIDRQLQKIMKKYLLPAGHEFQKVWNDYQRLLNGKDLVDDEALDELHLCKNNNTRKELLERIQQYQLPHYDDLGSVYPDLRTKIVSSVREARKTEPRPIEVPGGSFDGVTVAEYVDLVADILDQFRYVDIEGTFDSVCQLFLAAESEEERDRLLRSANVLSAHNLEIWKRAGPYVQHVLLGMIQGFDDATFQALRPIIVNVAQEALKTTVSGTSSTYKTITFSTGSIQPSEQLTKVRKEALSIAKKLFATAGSLQEKREVLAVFSEAVRLPHMGKYSDALVTEVLSDTAGIVEYYAEIAPSEEFEVLQAIEHDLLWWYRWQKGVTEEVVSDQAALVQRDRLYEEIQKFRAIVGTNEQFAKFKVLVGFESVFPQAWEDENFEVDGEDEYRIECIDSYVKQITGANAGEWFAFIRRCAETDTTDGATFRFFRVFLELVGEQKGKIALSFLEEIEGSFAWIVVPLLNGLAKSDYKSDADKKVAEWIETDKFAPQTAQHFQSVSSLNSDLLKKLQDRAISRSDTETVLGCLTAVLERKNEVTSEIEKGIIHPAFQYLTEHKNTNWIHFCYYLRRNKSFLLSASEKTIDLALRNLIYAERIDHRSERILCIIAETRPEKVIDFFVDRIRFKEEKGTSDRYQAVPFEFRDLKDELSKSDDYLLEATRNLFSSDGFLRQGRATRLLTGVLPSFPSGFAAKINALIQPENHDDLEFVAHVLSNYQGSNCIYEASKNLIDALEPSDSLLSVIRGSLLSTGVVSGEFGMVEAYQRKKDDIGRWLSDEREKVRNFAESLLSSLDNHITSEQQRAEEDLAMRKLEWDADEEDDDQDEGPLED